MKIYLISLSMLMSVNACKQEMPEPPAPQSAAIEQAPGDCIVLGATRSIETQLRKLENEGKINSDEKYQLAQYSNYMDISSILEMLVSGGGFDISSILGKLGSGGGLPDFASILGGFGGGGLPGLGSLGNIGASAEGGLIGKDSDSLGGSDTGSEIPDDTINDTPSSEDIPSGC